MYVDSARRRLSVRLSLPPQLPDTLLVLCLPSGSRFLSASKCTNPAYRHTQSSIKRSDVPTDCVQGAIAPYAVNHPIRESIKVY